jgi:hypothetical protein
MKKFHTQMLLELGIYNVPVSQLHPQTLLFLRSTYRANFLHTLHAAHKDEDLIKLIDQNQQNTYPFHVPHDIDYYCDLFQHFCTIENVTLFYKYYQEMKKTMPEHEINNSITIRRYYVWYRSRNSKKSLFLALINNIFEQKTIIDVGTCGYILDGISHLPVKYRKPLMDTLIQHMKDIDLIHVDEHGSMHIIPPERNQIIFMKHLISSTLHIDISTTINYICAFNSLERSDFELTKVPAHIIYELFDSLFKQKDLDTLLLLWSVLTQTSTLPLETTYESKIPIFLNTAPLQDEKSLYRLYSYLTEKIVKYKIPEFAEVLWNDRLRTHNYLKADACVNLLRACVMHRNVDLASDILQVMKARRLEDREIYLAGPLLWIVACNEDMNEDLRESQWRNIFTSVVERAGKNMGDGFLALALRSASYYLPLYRLVLETAMQQQLWEALKGEKTLEALIQGLASQDRDVLSEFVEHNRKIFEATMKVVFEGLMELKENRPLLMSGLALLYHLRFNKLYDELVQRRTSLGENIDLREVKLQWHQLINKETFNNF